jgi:signal transduction histidine kinase
MRFHKTLSVLLINLPARVRLGIVGLSYLLCVAIFASVFLTSHNGSIFAISIAVAAWMLKPRGALISLGCTVLTLMVFNSLSVGGILWPSWLLLTFFTGCLALLVEGVIIGLLRQGLEMAQALGMAQAAQFKAQQAEQEMAIALEQQRQLNQLKDQFLLNVSHELRTPLTEVSGYIELLSDHQEDLDTALQATFLKHARDGCQELLLLVNQVLAATQTSSEVNPPQFEAYSVVQVVREVVEHLDPRHTQDYQLHLDIPEHLTVWADPQHLRHLLSNAFKYCPRQTAVVISAALSERIAQGTDPPAQVCISVKDTGPGIPPAELPLLFGKFVRLKRDLTGTTRGSGLGLYISKQLVEAMHGRIWVESPGRAGEGSCFCFTLPTPAHASLDGRTNHLVSP